MNKFMEIHAAYLVATLPDEALIKLSTVLVLFDISKSKWYRGINQGKYPKPVKQGRSSRWVVSEIRAALEALKENR